MIHIYWGSVRFFKHVILTLAVLVLAAVVILLFLLLGGKGEPAPDSAVLSVTDRLGEGDARFAGAVSELQGGSAQAFLALCEEQGITPGELVTALERADAEGVQAAREAEQPAYTKLFPELYAKQAERFVYKEKTVYLTFDDGPSANTDPILDTLSEYGIKATFFVCPNADGSDAERLKRLADAGHTIGIHSATHDYETIYESVEGYLADFSKASDLVYEATGKRPDIFRFPGGSINNHNRQIYKSLIVEMTRRGFTYYDWHVDGGEVARATPDSVYRAVMDNVSGRDRTVVLLHDGVGKWQAAEALERIVVDLSEQGYQFDCITNSTTPITFGYSPE